MTSQISARPGWWVVFFDIVLIIGVLLALKSALLRVDAIWSYAGPISLLAALGVASWRLRASGEGWAGLGLGRPKSIGRTALWTLIALVVTMGAGILAEQGAVLAIGEADEARQALDTRYQGRFDNVPGNLSAYLFWIVMAWAIGGFTEEMLFRGALFARFERLFGPIPFAAALAVIAQAVLFGQQHYYYQGLAGWVATGVIGAVSGFLYLAFRRNLWPLIISHGLSNTIGLTLIYLGLMS